MRMHGRRALKFCKKQLAGGKYDPFATINPSFMPEYMYIGPE
jgi:hypothetical protein